MMTAWFVLILTFPVLAQSGDKAQIRDLIPQFTAAWSRGDAQAIAGLFASDGDLIIPTGNVFSGRESITAFYASVLTQGYRGSKGTGEIARIRFVQPGVAVGDGTWSITGARDRAGQVAAPERGVFTFVAVKQDGKWRISALREQTSAVSLTYGS